MNQPSPPVRVPIRLRELTNKSFDGALNEGEVRELETMLLASQPSRRWYAEAVMLHNDLAANSQANEICKQLHEEFSEPAEPAGAHEARSQSFAEEQADLRAARLSSMYRRVSQWAVAASVLLAGLGVGCGVGIYAAATIYGTPEFRPAAWVWKAEDDVVGRIESTHEVVWQSADVPETLPTQSLRAGQQIRIDSGLVSLSLRNGAGLILRGPAVFELRSELGGKLFEGRLSLTTPDGGAFAVATPVGTLNCGGGAFGVEVTSELNEPAAEFYALPHTLREGVAARFLGNEFLSREESVHDLRYSESIRVDTTGLASAAGAGEGAFPLEMPPARWDKFTGDTIPLGNLFDDGKTASLNEAVASDEYQAAGETIDLGVAAIQDGGLDVDVSLADEGVRFNLMNVGGGGPRVRGLPSNDTFRSVSAAPIRTTGADFEASDIGAKIEDGVGMCANEMITFDLDELRRAGSLGEAPMRFVVDRAGINDRGLPYPDHAPIGSVRFVVIVSTEDGVLTGHVDGEEYPVARLGDVYQFAVTESDLTPVVTKNGRFVSFDVPVPAEARFLTLAATMIEFEHEDQAVFSGARLEVLP